VCLCVREQKGERERERERESESERERERVPVSRGLMEVQNSSCEGRSERQTARERECV